MYSFVLVVLILQLIDYHKCVSNAQTTEVTAPRYSRLGSRIEVTCSFTGELIAIEWRKTAAGAPNSDDGKYLLSYIVGRTVEGPGKSRGMDISTDNYSLIIDSVMCEDTGAFWCRTTLRGVSPTEKNDTTEVYNFTQPIMVEPSDVAVDCEGQDADFCVMEESPLQCQVLGLKPRNENDIDLQVSPGNDEGSDIQKTSYTYNETGVDYTFYNAETSVKAIWNDGLTQEYICTVATAAFTQSSNPLRIYVKKDDPEEPRFSLSAGAIAGIAVGILVIIIAVVVTGKCLLCKGQKEETKSGQKEDTESG